MIAQIFDIIAPVFLLIAAGVGVAKLGWLSEPAIDGMMSFALKFAAPSLLFLSVSRLDIAQAFNWSLMLYPTYSKTRKFWFEIMRKLSVT